MSTSTTSYDDLEGKDLSEVLGPIGGVFGLTTTSTTHHQLSEEDIKFYHENGFVVSKYPVLSEDQVDILRTELSHFANPQKPSHRHPLHQLFYEFHHNETGDPDQVVMHCLGHWRIMPGYHDLIYLQSITVPAAQLIGAPVRFWHDQVFYKPPKHGGVVQWHQDYSYWTRTVPMNHLTVHIALDDQTPQNGGICYIPGSHHWHRDGHPLPPAAKKDPTTWKAKIDDASFDSNMDAIKSVLTEEELRSWEKNPPRCIGLKKGHAVFHHPLVVHGSFDNRTERPRRAAVVNYFADGTCAATTEPLLLGTPSFSVGEKMHGKFYPIVIDPKNPQQQQAGGSYSF